MPSPQWTCITIQMLSSDNKTKLSILYSDDCLLMCTGDSVPSRLAAHVHTSNTFSLSKASAASRHNLLQALATGQKQRWQLVYVWNWGLEPAFNLSSEYCGRKDWVAFSFPLTIITWHYFYSSTAMHLFLWLSVYQWKKCLNREYTRQGLPASSFPLVSITTCRN